MEEVKRSENVADHFITCPSIAPDMLASPTVIGSKHNSLKIPVVTAVGTRKKGLYI